MDVSIPLEPQVDISVPLEPQVDVSVPLKQQMDVSPHNAMYQYCCIKNNIFRNPHVDFYLFKLFVYFIHKNMCLYILG